MKHTTRQTNPARGVATAAPRATYDPSVDAYYLEFAATRGRVTTHEVEPGVYLDLGPSGRLLAIEVLDASERLPRALLEGAASAEEWLTLADAAAEAGLSPTTLRVQIRNGRLTARKQGRDWLVSHAALETYLINRDGRRARAAEATAAAS